MNFELKYPLLSGKWKWIAYALFPFPLIFLALTYFLPFDFPQDSVADLMYLCWAVGFGLLNFIKEPTEDEMIEQLRLKSFAMGVYYLIWGLGVHAIIQIFASSSIFTNYMSAYLAVFLLNTYIYMNFRYLKWTNR
jgi:FtsH-binding integral membrane protein